MKRQPLAILTATLLLSTSLCTFGFASEPLPKYGPKGSPKAIPLALSNDYFRNPKNTAPGFWALISHYIPQATGASCSSATLVMALNAARAKRPKNADEPVITEKALLETVNLEHIKERLSKTGYRGKYGATLDQLTQVAAAAFQHYGFPKASAKAVHLEQKTPQAKAELIQELKSLSDRKFILANFNQKVFTDDAQVGHFAPIGAFDEAREQVLILDPDREYYEPYWVSLNTFMEGMATQDSMTQKNRGYISIEAGP